MQYTKNNKGDISLKVTEWAAPQPIPMTDVHAEWLAKRRVDITRDIELRQQELADVEAEIASFDTVSDITVGNKTPGEIVLEIQAIKESKKIK